MSKVKLPKIPPVYLAAGAAAAALLLWLRVSGPRQVGETVASGAVDLADGVFSGTVKGVGEVFGIPNTNPDRCAAAKAAGNTWEASFACPAGDFIRYWWNK